MALSFPPWRYVFPLPGGGLNMLPSQTVLTIKSSFTLLCIVKGIMCLSFPGMPEEELRRDNPLNLSKPRSDINSSFKYRLVSLQS